MQIFLSPQRNNAQVIANSLLNLKEKELILAPEDDPHISSELKKQGAELKEGEGLEQSQEEPTKKKKKKKEKE